MGKKSLMAQEATQTGALAAAPTIDTSELVSTYANACRISQTPAEMVIDFGLYFAGVQNEPLKLETRVILTHEAAKRLLLNLASALQAHEATYGVIELDPAKRRTQPPA